MKINRVEMFGFKSFVNKTSVSFSEGIAAIVGPNGCGKSNIVDAIRWVLGEQSPRQLRGNVMEDVIFAGSESRAPLGVAEVTITLANGNGTAPPPFENMSEIAVTRRLYRSGESEYLINKAPCRLKDIVYLFMDTGVGTRAYSIIDQGQIGGFIEAKPGERRILVEEVAGISKFKFKKDEALRKIEHTRQNLLRLEDILGEVKRQMNSLHRQAKKADRYLELKQNLKGLELFLASADYAKWQDILTRKEEVITIESEKENALAARIAQLELNAEELELESLEQEKLIEEQRSKAHHLEKLIQDKRNRIEYLNHSLEEIKRHLADTAQGLEREEQHKKEIAAQKERCIKEAESLNSKVAERHTELAGAEKRLQELRTEQRAILDALEDHKMEMVGLLSRETHHRNRIRTIEQTLAALNQKRQRNQDDRREVASAREITRQERTAKTNEQAELEEEINAIPPFISRLKAREETMEEGLQALQKKLREITQAHTQKTAKLDLLKNLHTNLEGIPAGTRALLHNNQGGSGIQGLLADFLETAPELTMAIESVLGSKLQALVVEDVDQAIEAITGLKDREGGRSGFLSLTGKEAATPPEQDRLLVHRIKTLPPYHNLVRQLLRDVYWFETLQEARTFWEGQGGQCTVVTRDGDIIDQSGFIEGGSRQGAPAGFFSRKEEIRQLTGEVDELRSAIEETKKDLNEAETGLADIQAERRQKEGELAQKQFEHRLKKQKQEQLTQTEEIHKKRLALLEQEESEFDREGAVLTQELAEVREELEKMQSVKSSLQAEIDLRENDAAALEGEMEGSHAYVTETKMELTSLKEKIRHLESEAGRLDQEYERLGALGQRLQAKMEEFVGQQDKIIGEIAGAEGSLTVDTQKQQEAGELLQDYLQQHQQKKESLMQIQAELKAGQKDLKEVQAGLNSLSVAKTEAQLNIRHLEDKIHETYHISLREEYSAYADSALSTDEALAEAQQIREDIARIGEVNLTAIQEYKELEERHDFLSTQYHDLISSIQSLEQAIQKINRTSKERVYEAIKAINEKLSITFPTLFGGGRAELKLADPDDPLGAGIEIYAEIPGKILTNLNLLSGGEKALTTLALLFAVYMVKPSPFCLLDEVDAPLDEANTERFNSMLKEIGREAQIILITHNQKVMEAADVLYGVTMEEKGISKLLSVRLN